MRIDTNIEALPAGSGLLYGVLTALFLALFAVSVHFLAIEPDEAWILLSTGQLAGGPFHSAHILNYPAVTSGGLHTLIHYALLRLGLPIDAHRLVSLLFCVLMLAMVYALAKTQSRNARGGLLAVAAFLTTPGFLLQAGLATAEMMSAFLVIAAAWHWSSRGSVSLAGSAVSGVLFGLSFATRFTALIALPAIIIWSLLYARIVPSALLHAVVASATAVAVFLLSVGVYYSLFGADNLHAFTRDLAQQTGFEYHKGVTSVLSYFVISESLFPTSIMVVAAVALIPSRETVSLAAIRPLCVLLLLIGMIGWAAWIARAPLPHLRYLWPALPALWLCGVLILLDWLATPVSDRARLLLHAAIFSVWATQFVVSFRHIAYGDSLTLVYEAARQVAIRSFPPFRARQDQGRMASVVEGLPADAEVYALVEPFAYPIVWLTNRKILSLSTISKSPLPVESERYLILFPWDKTIWRPNPALLGWIQANATLQSQFDGYSVYRIKVNAPLELLPERFAE